MIYSRRRAGCGLSTTLPDMDFETYSEAGYVWDPTANKWKSITSSPPHGLGAVGAWAYSEHPSTEVLSLAYDLKNGRGEKLWVPGMQPPADLFDHIARGETLEAWNSGFEYVIWLNVCHARMGWPALPYYILRDAMAKARAHALPGGLEGAAMATRAEVQKLTDGKRLITKFCKPRNPTKKDPRRRVLPSEEPEDSAKLYEYNVIDIKAEASVSALIPDLSQYETQVWLLDQRINNRGVGVDVDSIKSCLLIIDQALKRGVSDLTRITNGVVDSPTKIKKMISWLKSRGFYPISLDADAVSEGLKRTDLSPEVMKVLRIRASLGAASVKKLSAMDRRMSTDGRIRGLFMYCGADRTGRWAGRGVQPQNLPNSGPAVQKCLCGHHYGVGITACPWCGDPEFMATEIEWGLEAVEEALTVAATGDLNCMEYFFGDAVATISGCLRGMLCAAPGYELICSDYSAIEAVVLAALAGETWRLEVFRTHGKIYEMSASKITGVPFDEFTRHKAETGDHHPFRKKIGKVAELASGYGGSVGAWKAFGAEKHFDTDEDILAAVRQWRKDSPSIVKFWYKIEDAAVAAIKQPGTIYTYRDISFGMKEDVLYCRLPSGRLLSYHAPRLHPDTTPFGRPVEKITYMGWNTDYKKGPKGWLRLDTWGGKLTENICQAVSRDILAHAMLKVDVKYPIVMHVHDEIISEVPEGFGTIEEFETLMADMPAWCAHWPIRAAGGWRGKRYRKD